MAQTANPLAATATTTSAARSTAGSAARAASATTNPAVGASAPARTARAGTNPGGASSSTTTTTSSAQPGPPPPSLSAMRSAPLDLRSVERRGQASASREGTKKIRPHALQEAPTYRPTEEEFKDPFEYMRKITPEASKYGICKIIPPESWNPDFAIDTERFHFRTRKQELNSIEGSTRANLTYLDQLAKFHKLHGTNLNRFPSVDKRPLDLFKLRRAVDTRGGFDRVCKLKKWAEVGRELGYSGKIMSSLSTSLKNSYQRWLLPYEEYLRFAKPGVHQQLEVEYGGPLLTPSPGESPMKRSAQHTPSSLRDGSPAMRASEALNASMKEESSGQATTENFNAAASSLDSAPRLETQRSGGFTAVNHASGFTPVNAAPASFPPVNIRRDREREEVQTTPPRRPQTQDSPLSSAMNTPEHRPSSLAPAAVANGFTSNPGLKRQMSHDSLSSKQDANGDDEEREGRRSKRLKKDPVPTVAGSHMTFHKPMPPRIPGEQSASRCETCTKAEDRSNLIICESCDHGYHVACLDQKVVPKADLDWHCPRCLVGDGQFGFEEGGVYSLKQFQEKAAEFKEGYFQNKMPFDPVLNCPRSVTEDDIEREFWRLVASLEETVEVEYGADIHSTTHGSGFPTLEKCPQDPYSTDPWNLNIMPLHADSLFRHIKSDISGMTVPWLYVGMMFSTFCWHNEDHYAYSANYQHFGATKTWYGIPGEDAEKFEAAMRDAVPELFETQPDLLFQLVTLLTPEQLRKADVRVYALDQRAGQFVLTFPQAYHAGFNHGFNFNEAVNIAPSDWEPFGDAGVERLQQFRRQPCFSHDELLWTAAEGAATGGVTIQTAKWLAPALQRMKDRELSRRAAFLEKHQEVNHDAACNVTASFLEGGSGCHLNLVVDNEDIPEDEYQCAYCKSYAYLSRYVCASTSTVLCILHAGVHPCCAATEEDRYTGKAHTLHYRRTDEAITQIQQKVADKAHLPENWEEKVEKALADPTPALKTMRSLMHEGERIPYELQSLSSLKAFVDRCNEWVEEATNYIVRKQQNRRKNEKAWRKGSKAAELEERDKELRKVENILKLIRDAERLGFECPEIVQLRDRASSISKFRSDATSAIADDGSKATSYFEELLELGRSFNVDLPELETIETILHQKKWHDEVREKTAQVLTLKDVDTLISQGAELHISEDNHVLVQLKEQQEAGRQWDAKAMELIEAETVHYPQLEALSNQASMMALAVSAEVLAAVDQILNRQREAQKHIVSLNERSRSAEYKDRPKYVEAREVLNELEKLNSKPSGTTDLEREVKRHEDWIRKGKRLFGKSNAPLHILKSHMVAVLARNIKCFNITTDKPRVPAEPASRDNSPAGDDLEGWDEPRTQEVFCICRSTEDGLMIECDLCHEWYHSKCLKMARGKVKPDDKYACPICDWRGRIPRDAARPKLEDLLIWQYEIQQLPFQADEEELLQQIIVNAQEFRDHVAVFCSGIMATADESETQRFYLRKIEGAEILLAFETNFFRQELHKWAPVAPEPPPILESSKSTRKPRPTKLQKLMAQHGVDKIEDLPQDLRTKQHQFKPRKSSDAHSTSPTAQDPPRPPQLQTGMTHRRSSLSKTPTAHVFPPQSSSAPNSAHVGHHHAHPSMASSHFGYHDPPFSRASAAGSAPFAGHPYYPASVSPVYGGTGGSTSPTRAPGVDMYGANPTLDSGVSEYPRLDPQLGGLGMVPSPLDAFTQAAAAVGPDASIDPMFDTRDLDSHGIERRVSAGEHGVAAAAAAAATAGRKAMINEPRISRDPDTTMVDGLDEPGVREGEASGLDSTMNEAGLIEGVSEQARWEGTPDLEMFGTP